MAPNDARLPSERRRIADEMLFPTACKQSFVNKRSLNHQILRLPLPTLQGDAVIFTRTSSCVRPGESVVFLSYLL